MEGYSSMFTSSSNSGSASSPSATNNFFPFSMNNTSDALDDYYDHHRHIQNDGSSSLMSQMMIMGGQQPGQDEELIMHQRQSLDFAPIFRSQELLHSNNSDNYNNDNNIHVSSYDHHQGHDARDDELKKREKKETAASAEKKIKKHRFAFQTRSQVDILDDGYRWRKYGQKAVKNNKFPRSYYRCTYQGCNVKKQVQRLSKDEGVVVTTYEGIHSHPIEKSTDNFEHILTQMQIYTSI